ncbi:MAG: alpha/beta hydrolase [Kofleriaceae bacterium]|jgi:pimeloyl-ACP methyl ester carboxylesterase/tetratricopeptide (TPR) repeat protein|nr:alpha/beta hydrolase [Kofleriaceae bacterium]
MVARASLIAWLLVACGPRAVAPPACPPVAPASAAPPAAGADREVDGLRYRVSGDATAATTLVLVHGNFDRLETWEPIVPALVAAGFQVVTLDLPGYGQSRNRHDDYTLRGLAEGVRTVVEAVGAARVVLVGNSLGGAVVATYAAAWPATLAGVVLEDANFSYPDEWPSREMTEPFTAILRAAAAGVDAADPAAAHAALREAIARGLPIALRRPGAVTDAVIDRYTAGLEGRGYQAVVAARAAVTTEGLAARFATAHAAHPFPLLVAWGLDDPLLPVAAAERIRRTVPAARLWLIAGTGHAPHLERPAELAAAIAAQFGPGGPLPDDQVVIPAGATVATPWPVAELPVVERAIRRQVAAAGGADALAVAPWLALDALALGDLDGVAAALAIMTAATDAATQARAALVRGLLASARGEDATPALLAALASDEDWVRELALTRLALSRLTPGAAATVDAALGPLAPTESIRRRVARAARAMATGRYQDAVAQFDGWNRGAPEVRALWLGLALYGAGRLDEADAVASRRPAKAPPDDPLATVRDALEHCRWPLASRIDRARGWDPLLDWPCEALVDVRHLADELPPPALGHLTTATGDPATALGAAEGAAAALATGDDAGARAALAAVDPALATQVPAYHRLRLALAAAAGDRRAVAEARALVARHDGGWPWRWALATTLHAAGKLADAERELREVVAIAPIDPVREELAWLLVDRGHLAEARALRARLAASAAWRGVAARLPHQRRAAAALAAPP